MARPVRKHPLCPVLLLAVAVGTPLSVLAQPIPIVAFRADLRANRPPTATRTFAEGRVNIRAFVNNNDYVAFGDLKADLAAGRVSLQVTDNAGFDVTISLTNCTAVGDRYYCSGNSGERVHATVVPAHNMPRYFLVRARQRLLGNEAGTVTPVAPVTVTLIQSPGVERSDSITTCQTRSRLLKCVGD
jgi:hypothetical protein